MPCPIVSPCVQPLLFCDGVRSHMKRRSLMADKYPLDKVTDSGQVSESFLEITTFSGSITLKRYASNGLEPPTNLRPFNTVFLPLIWRPGTRKPRHGRIRRLALLSTLTEMETMSTGHLLSESTRLPDWGWILRWTTFRTKILTGYSRRSRR